MSNASHSPLPLLVERSGAVVALCFNRPQSLNAVDVPMAQALLAAAHALRANPVQGAADLLGPLNEAPTVLASLNAPLIAQVHGVAAGAGLSLMLQADFVLAAEGTRFNLAYGAMKRLMRTSFDRDLDAQLTMEAAAFDQCVRTQDFKTGVEAFYAKQPAQFIGR